MTDRDILNEQQPIAEVLELIEATGWTVTGGPDDDEDGCYTAVRGDAGATSARRDAPTMRHLPNTASRFDWSRRTCACGGRHGPRAVMHGSPVLAGGCSRLRRRTRHRPPTRTVSASGAGGGGRRRA